MSRIQLSARLALPILALATSTASAQVFFGGSRNNTATISRPGGVNEGGGGEMCHVSGGGTRTRANCETEPQPILPPTEQAIPISIAIRGAPGTQCNAAATTEYEQLDAFARINSTLSITDCPAAHGSLTFSVRVRDETPEVKLLEFEETWARSDDQDARIANDYPIGENVELLSVRIGTLQCTCGDPPAEEAETAAEPVP